MSSHGFSENQLCLWKYPSMLKMKEFRGHTSRCEGVRLFQFSRVFLVLCFVLCFSPVCFSPRLVFWVRVVVVVVVDVDAASNPGLNKNGGHLSKQCRNSRNNFRGETVGLATPTHAD